MTIKFGFKLLLIALFVAGIYLFFATGGFKDLNWPNDPAGNRYDQLAKALLNGHLYLGTQGDPALNIWDLSLYEGKYYLYFGIVPTFLFYLPANLLGANHFPSSVSVFLFCFGVFLISVDFLRLFRERFFPNSSGWVFIASIFVVAFSNGSILELDRPIFYQEAITGAVFFLFLGIWSFLKFFSSSRNRYLLITSTSLALAVACRPTALLSSIVILSFASIAFWRQLIRNFQKVVCLFGPFCVGIAGVALYNYLRFDSFSEFGWNYQHSVFYPLKMKLFAFERILPGLYFNLLQLPERMNHFPFLFVRSEAGFLNLPDYYWRENPIGLLPFTPILWLFIPGAISLIEMTQPQARRMIEIFTICGLAALFNLVIFPAAVDRYYFDYAPFFVIVSCFFWIFLDQNLKGSGKKYYLISTLAGISAIWSCYMNVFVAVNRG